MKKVEYTKLPKSRAEAKARGLDRYFTGSPCKHGHIAPRYVSTTNCVPCQGEHARRLGGWQARPSSETYLEKVRKIVEQRGGVLPATKYVSANTKLKVRCDDHHEFEISPDNLARGKWCGECKRQKHAKRMATNYRSVEELRKFARDHHGGDCLATKPNPMLSKAMWTCRNSEHPPFPAVIAKVIHSGQWCPLCWQERREPPQPAIPREAVEEKVRQLGGEIVKVEGDGVWKSSKTRVVVRCANGHEWPADASNLLYAGSWCPNCLNKGERIVRAIFEVTFGGKFPKSKPEWLVSKKGRKLELDGSIRNRGSLLNIRDHIITRSNTSLNTIRLRRPRAANRVRLIEVDAIKRPYPGENVLQKVVEAFAKYGLTETPRVPEGETFAAELKEIRQVAAERGGRLVSEVYLGAEQHEWKCEVAEHPTWLAEPWRIRRGAWCPSCAGNLRLGLEDIRSWGRSIGLELLDTEYRGTLAVYTWRCVDAAHVIERSRSNIKQSILRGLQPCTKCAGTSKTKRADYHRKD
jgi:hypothetical protein